MKLSRLKIAHDTTLYGFRSVVVAIGYIGISKVLIALGPNEAAASSIITTTQGLIVGAGAGFVTSIGGEIAKIKGQLMNESDPEIIKAQIGYMIKTGLVQTFFMGGMGALICITSRYWIPPILSNKTTANYAADYMVMFSPAVLWDFLLLYSAQLVFKIENNAWFGLVTSMTFRIPSIFLASYLGRDQKLGAKGIGFSSSLIGFGTVILCAPWFFKKTYREILTAGHYSWNDFKRNLKTLFDKGWKLSLQRITEWGNLYIIVQIIGVLSDKDLIAVQPSILLITLMGQLVQGFSLAGMMIANEDSNALKKCKLMKSQLVTSSVSPLIDSKITPNPSVNSIAVVNPVDLDIQFQTLKNKVKHNFWVGNGAGLGCNLIFMISLWSAKNALLEWTLPSEAEEETTQVANTLYLINLASTIGDTLRVITGGLLYGCDDILFPIMVSLVAMTGLGIPIGLGISLGNRNITPFFILRLLTIFIAAGLNIRRFFSFLNEHDETESTPIQDMEHQNSAENKSRFQFDSDTSAEGAGHSNTKTDTLDPSFNSSKTPYQFLN